jgi:hypothetical protein
MPYFAAFEQQVTLIMDGGYAKESVVKPLYQLKKQLRFIVHKQQHVL